MMLATGLVSAAGQWGNRIAATWVSVQPGDYDPSSGHGPEWGKAAPAGLLIWLFMGTALFFLIKSMNRHIKRVPKSFAGDSSESAADAPAAASEDSSDENGSDETSESADPETDVEMAVGRNVDMTMSAARADSVSADSLSADSLGQKPE